MAVWILITWMLGKHFATAISKMALQLMSYTKIKKLLHQGCFKILKYQSLPLAFPLTLHIKLHRVRLLQHKRQNPIQCLLPRKIKRNQTQLQILHQKDNLLRKSRYLLRVRRDRVEDQLITISVANQQVKDFGLQPQQSLLSTSRFIVVAEQIISLAAPQWPTTRLPQSKLEPTTPRMKASKTNRQRKRKSSRSSSQRIRRSGRKELLTSESPAIRIRI